MSKELNLGDKIWFHYGPSVLMVGHIVDNSPDYEMIGVSPLPYKEYQKMTTTEKATCPISWCELKACHYICHIPYNKVVEADKQVEKIQDRAGFLIGR